jgi:hypothetical protein
VGGNNEMVSKLIKFEFGMLLGTVIGAVVAAFICSISFGVLGFKNTNLPIIQKCLVESIKNK